MRHFYTSPVVQRLSQNLPQQKLRRSDAPGRYGGGTGGWLEEAKDDTERAQREASDFLLPADHDGEILDFHSLRHTYGRFGLRLGRLPSQDDSDRYAPSNIGLTMDAYGHLWPRAAY